MIFSSTEQLTLLVPVSNQANLNNPFSSDESDFREQFFRGAGGDWYFS